MQAPPPADTTAGGGARQIYFLSSHVQIQWPTTFATIVMQREAMYCAAVVVDAVVVSAKAGTTVDTINADAISIALDFLNLIILTTLLL